MRDAPLDTCPIYVKAGTILPLMEEQSYVGEKPLDTLTVMVWQGEGAYEHYLDNGADFAYRNGTYNQYRFTAGADGTVTCRLVHAGYDKPYQKILVKRFGEEEAEEIKVL